MTNALNFLPKCDHVIVIDHGQIVETGTYHELKAGQSKFSNLLREFTGNETEEVQLPEVEIVDENQSHDDDDDEDLADVYTVDDGTSIIGKENHAIKCTVLAYKYIVKAKTLKAIRNDP